MFNIFKKKIKPINGVLRDNRTLEEKNKDFKTEEILAMAQLLVWEDWEIWKTKPENIKMLNDISVNNQDGVGSCASQSSSLALAINNYLEDGKFIKFSAKPIYARRSNKLTPGMYMQNAGEICTTYGTVPEINYPSPNDSESNMSDLNGFISLYEGIGKLLKAKSYLWLDNNIDAYAQVLSMGKPIVMTFVFGDTEFGDLAPVVKPVVPKYGHAVCALPNAYFTYQGKKAILIQNSWGTGYGMGGRQILTEDWFLNNRVICAIWFEDEQNLDVFKLPENKPHYVFNNDLNFGMNNDEVKKLQECLRYDGEFNYPTNTGYFGGLTLKSVKDFQTKYLITPVSGFVGPITRAKLNLLFA